MPTFLSVKVAGVGIGEGVACDAVVGESDGRGGGPVVDLVDARGTDRQREAGDVRGGRRGGIERVVAASVPVIVMPATVTAFPVPTFLSANVALLSASLKASPATRLSVRVTVAAVVPS